MLEFDMPGKSEKYRYGKTKAALEALAGKPIGNIKVFELDITEGNILETLIKRTELNGFQKRFALGCPVSEELPHFEYSCKNNGTEISYKREINPKTRINGFYKKGVLDLKRAAGALGDKDCEETFQFYKKSERVAARIFRSGVKCYFELNGCRADEEEMKKEGFNISDAVNLALDFYEPEKHLNRLKMKQIQQAETNR